MPNNPHEELLARLTASWPVEWRNAGERGTNPLRFEIEALRRGEAAHLPFFRGEQDVAWLTVAGTATALRAAITGLRAWIIPSFGWEDRVRPIVQPADYTGPLAAPLSAISPSGYYRWHSRAKAARGSIAEKLVLWRRLRSLRPETTSTAEPSLFELREQFQLALATGDRTLAEAAIAALDERQLDTAANTSFMRTRMRAWFGAHAEIVQDPNLSRIIALRLPQSVRVAITEAFYHVYARNLVVAENPAAARVAVADQIFPQIAGLLRFAQPEDGDGTRWLLEHLPVGVVPPDQPKSRQDAFFEALRRCDWPVVQKTGLQLLDGTGLREALRPLVQAGLAESLKYRPEVTVQAVVHGPGQKRLTPEDWSQFVAALRCSDLKAAEAFLELPQRPGLESNDPRVAEEITSAFVELFTAPQSGRDTGVAALFHRSLAFLVEDLVGDRRFPQCELADAYLALMQAWVASRCGSTLPADSSVVISLAAGILQCRGCEEGDVAGLLRNWWEGRPVKVRLPFLLNALEVLGEYTSQPATAQGLWIDGATFIRSHAVALTPTEARLWRAIGQNLGFDRATTEEYVPVDAELDDDAVLEDLLPSSGLRKVAIVSLHERAARAAAELIVERSGAEVVLVNEVVAGASTDSALTADVILLVWAATKHAVYRAFDDVRNKVVYVQGTGISSIVLALENWLIKQGSAHST